MHHISFRSGIYSSTFGMPDRLERFLAAELDIPANTVVVVSERLPIGSWDFIPELTVGTDGLKNRLAFSIIQKQDDYISGFGATVVTQIVQVFELSESCEIDEMLVEP